MISSWNYGLVHNPQEDPPFIANFPIQNHDFPIATLVYQRVPIVAYWVAPEWRSRSCAVAWWLRVRHVWRCPSRAIAWSCEWWKMSCTWRIPWGIWWMIWYEGYDADDDMMMMLSKIGNATVHGDCINIYIYILYIYIHTGYDDDIWVNYNDPKILYVYIYI